MSAFGRGVPSSEDNRSESANHRSSMISAHSSSNISLKFSSRGHTSSLFLDAGNVSETNVAPPSRAARLYSMFCDSRCCQRLHIRPSSRLRCKQTIRSRVWKGLMIVFYTFALFGYQLHMIFSVKDVVYNTLALITFIFFVLEMVLMTIAEPNYVIFDISSFAGNKFLAAGADGNKSCSLGSFLFWCDLVSTIVLLYGITWINKGRLGLKTVDIFLDADGFPVRTAVTISYIFCFFSHTKSSGRRLRRRPSHQTRWSRN